jgi:regulator of cell morphogenesis and NO signaling
MSAEPTVAQLISQHPVRARAFEKHGIAYCGCGGLQTVREACEKRGLDLQEVLSEVERCERASHTPPCAGATHWQNAPLKNFIHHLAHDHHAYLRAALARLSFLIHRVASSHGGVFPEFREFDALYDEWVQAALDHLEYEERTLFPLLQAAEDAAPCNSVPSAVGSAILEHMKLNDELYHLRQSTRTFPAAQHSCNTFRVMLQALEETETEWARCLAEEEEVLFPRALDNQARKADSIAC